MTKIDWHPYPDEKPKKNNVYIVTFFSSFYKKTLVYDDGYDVEKDEWETFNDDGCRILAWAELPEPYRPPEYEDNHPDAITARKYMAGDPETVKALHIFDE